MDTDLFSKLTAIQTQLKVAAQQVDETLDWLLEEDPGLREGLTEAILAAAQQFHGSTAYYMYVRMQRKLAAEGYGHVKRAVISGYLLHAGWTRKRNADGILWSPPETSPETGD
jgi:hypothetical protein